MNLTYENLDKSMLEILPDLLEKYKKILYDDGKPRQHIVFGDVFNPYLIDLLKENKESELLEKIFDFLEKMATCSDAKVREVLMATVLERLGDDKELLEKARKYMGNNTLIASREVEKGWGRES